MVDIRPFRGVRYNQSLINDLATTICPPYDIITPQMREELYRQSDYNFVRLEFTRELPQDTDTDNKYTRSAATLEQWLKQGILKVDERPAIYLHDHYFDLKGKEYRRRGMVARIRLEDWDKKAVRPHEDTMAKPKSDRLSLMRALQANTSSVLSLFADREQYISSLLDIQEQGKPIISFSAVDGEKHSIRAITEAEAINQIRRSLAEQPLYIADGHHRYESALNYQREQRACSSGVSGDEGFNFVIMTLVDFADPGLVILPPHRLVRNLSKSAAGGLMDKLRSYFEIEELPLSVPDVWQRVDDFMIAEENQVKLVLFGPSKEHLFLLGLRDFTTASRMMPGFHSEIYRKLDVSVVDHIILEKLLELNKDRKESVLAYSYDRLDAIKKVLDKEYQLAFLLSPVRAEVIKAVSDADDRMPKKSTYFYPKLPSGLVFNRLV